jgi:hypothetical protein
MSLTQKQISAKKYYQKNKEKIAEQNKKYYEENKKRILKKARISWVVKKEKAIDDVEVCLRELLNKAKSRAKKHGRECNIDLAYLKRRWNHQKGFCNESGIKMLTSLGSGNYRTVSIDRIDSNLGYVVGNVQLVLSGLNGFKREMKRSQFIKLCNAVANHN